MRKMVDLEYEGDHIELDQKCEFEENFKSYQNMFLKEFQTTEDHREITSIVGILLFSQYNGHCHVIAFRR